MTGDSSGHVRVWDVREGVDISSSEACRASFKQVWLPAVPVLADVLCVISPAD